MIKQKILLTFFIVFLFSCTSDTLISSTENVEPIERLQMSDLGFVDVRSRFREIFCEVLTKHGSDLSDFNSCEQSLLTIGHEPELIPKAVDLNISNNSYIIGLVPGVAWQCVRNWLDNDNSGPEHVLTQGYDVRLFEVDGLSGSEKNALQIKNHVTELPVEDSHRPVILIGYSKGAADVLQAISIYPELRERVVAVVSVAGAVGGSPLANSANQSHLNLLEYIPMSGCESGDNKAIASLHTETRKTWLADNPLPEHIRYYSVISYPESDRISLGLKAHYNKLADIDSRNDGQLIFYHQLIPNSSLLGFFNADHWAMSIPVARQSYLNRISFANKNEYPREVLLEAILRYIEEDLKDTSPKP